MASGSGAWSPTTGGGNRGRLTWDITQSPSSVGSGTSSVSLRLRVWYESRYSVSDSSNSYTISGAWSGSGSRSINHGGSGGRTLLYDGTITVSTSYAGTVKRSFSASFSGINATPNIPSVSGSHTVGKRPNRAPNPPTWGSTTRVGTDKCTITWSNNPTTAGPITRNEVQYWSSVNQEWRVNSNSVSATATSYTAQNLGTNREYRYRVRAVGPGGKSAWVTGGTIATPPSAPSNVSAQKLAGGAIRVSGTDTAGPTNRARTFLIYDSPDGGAEVLVGTAGSLPWTFADPDPSVTHSFRIRTRINSQGEMLSPFSGRSNTVQLLAPPNAPTLLAPSGVVSNAAADVVFRWRHNPVDTTDQTAYELRYRAVGDSSWGTVTGTTEQSHTLIFIGTVGAYEWQVRTKGEHVDWSPWSSVSVFTLASPPTVAINAPESGVFEQSRVTLLLGYDHPEGSPQSRVQAELVQGGRVVETLSWAKGDTGTFRTDLDNDTTYTVRVRVQAANSLWSEWDEVTFTTDFPTPLPRVIEAEWDRDTGAVTVSSWADGVEGQFEWTGTPHDSTSEWWEYDHLVATNLETNPAGITGGGQGFDPDAIVAQGTFSVDERNRTSFAKNPNERIRAASVVKFITAHLTLEWVANLATVVTVIEDDMSGGSVAGLQPGDTITVDDLLYGLMLPSGNDAAKCLGRIVGGMMLAAEGRTGDPVARFVEEMNATTSAFGFPLFVIGSPSGSDSVSKCSPRELALTVKALWDAGSGSFAYAGTDTKTITVGGPNARQIPLQNTTERDGAVKFPEMIAAKTGLIAGIGNLVMVWEHPVTGLVHFSAVMNTSPSSQRFVDMREVMDQVAAWSGGGWGGASYFEPSLEAVFVPGGFGVDPFGVAPFGTPS